MVDTVNKVWSKDDPPVFSAMPSNYRPEAIT